MPLTRHFGAAREPNGKISGPVTVIALQDAEGPFPEPREGLFPTATATHWAEADKHDPQAVRDGKWHLRYRCFACRLDDGRVILIDTGIGPADAPARTWAPVPGRLPEELAEAGIDPDEVDTVVLTHLHTDHIGWTPLFHNARYLMQRVEIEIIDRDRPELGRWLRTSGQLSAVDGTLKIAPSISVVATPGHTPGHQSVLLEVGDDTVLFAGDLLVHAVQLVDPHIAYSNEADPEAARKSRVELLRDGVTLATAHLSEPFTFLTRPH